MVASHSTDSDQPVDFGWWLLPVTYQPRAKKDHSDDPTTTRGLSKSSSSSSSSSEGHRSQSSSESHSAPSSSFSDDASGLEPEPEPVPSPVPTGEPTPDPEPTFTTPSETFVTGIRTPSSTSTSFSRQTTPPPCLPLQAEEYIVKLRGSPTSSQGEYSNHFFSLVCPTSAVMLEFFVSD